MGGFERNYDWGSLTAIHDWHQALEIGKDVCAVFLDLSKAFDKVPHIPLLIKLPELNIP